MTQYTRGPWERFGFPRGAAGRTILGLISLTLPACGNVTGTNPQQEPPVSEAQLLLFRGVVGNPPRFDLVVVNADGGGERPLLGDSVEGSEVKPALFGGGSWSPGAERVAFAAVFDERGFETDIYTAAADSSGLARLTGDGSSLSPVWSPDGTTIVFAHSFGRPYPRGASLWVMQEDGSAPRPLTEEERGVFDTPGSFSPDGRSILFTRVTDAFELSAEAYVLSESDIYAVGLDGSHLQMLANEGADPAYSPDGETIAFVTDRDENGELCYGDRCFFAGELYLIAVDGTNQRRLTDTTDLNEADPAWSPDGERIAFTRGEVIGNAEATGVFSINPDGSCAGPILFDPKLDTWYSSPAWRPGEVAPGPVEC